MPLIAGGGSGSQKPGCVSFKRRVENGESFATLAILYSEDPGRHANGGEMDYVGRAMLDQAFATEAFNGKWDQVSKVVKSEFGYPTLSSYSIAVARKLNVAISLSVPRDPKSQRS